jgi:16S rRNA (cytosine967-C5)-methyltransferase
MIADTIGSSGRNPVHRTHLLLAAEAIAAILRGGKPADDILRELFRSHRNAGAKDRAAISALVYGVLRNYFPLREMLGQHAPPLELCAATVLRLPAALPALRELDAAALEQKLTFFAEADWSPAARHNLPLWLWEKLKRDFGEQEASALGLALNQPAAVDLRVNTLKGTREQALEGLAQDHITAVPTKRSPIGLRLEKRAALQNTRVFRHGWVEPQDEGSQLLALHVSPQPGETVADYCAGAGGKTLALGALMQNRGSLHAFDTNAARLARLEPRLQRAGVSIVRAQVLRGERDPRLAALANRCDKVLVDAPCSATGTLRRNPELRLREIDLAQLQALQLSILGEAAQLVRPAGDLVYATCSVLREENQDVVDQFIARHPAFQRGEQLQLLPHRDGTDGFYGATLVRVS